MDEKNSPVDGDPGRINYHYQYLICWDTCEQKYSKDPTSFGHFYAHHRTIFVFVPSMVQVAAQEKGRLELKIISVESKQNGYDDKS